MTAAAFAPVDQHYLLEARQMQALSFAVHIPLVAFAISFPAMVAKTAVAPFPSIDGDPKKTTATLGGWSLTVGAKSKAKTQAADFVKWLLAGDPAIMADFFKASGFSKFTVATPTKRFG